jgi:RNA polymerase sigma-70 factor (ECF subfamily)
MNRLYSRMESAATTCTIAPIMENSPREIADFDAVVRLYWPRIFRFALASLRDRDAAQTVAQDCFLKAWRGRARFRGEASLHTWLMQIAVNLVRDYVRNQRLRFWRKAAVYSVGAEMIGRLIPDKCIDSERRVLVKEQIDAVWRATTRLSERQRTVFLLRHVEDMEILEIAAVTGLTEGAVKVHLDRAVRSLRKHLGRFR